MFNYCKFILSSIQRSDYVFIIYLDDDRFLPLPSMRPRKPCWGASGKPHPNGGGFVADTATVDASAYVGPKAWVCHQSKVRGQARLEERSRALDQTEIIHYGKLSDTAVAYEQSRISWNGHASGNSRLAGNAHLHGDGRLEDHSRMDKESEVYGHGKLRHYAWTTDNSKIYDYAEALNYSTISGNVHLCGHYQAKEDIDRPAHSFLLWTLPRSLSRQIPRRLDPLSCSGTQRGGLDKKDFGS